MSALHVLLCLDDNVWAPVYATMRSVCIATRRRADLVFHLLEWRLTDEHRAQLDAITAEFGARLAHYRIEDAPEIERRLAALPATRIFPPVIFARLLFDRFLPPEVDRLVYLDGDVMVRAPIERLLDMDLAGNAVGAVLEPSRYRLILGDDMRSRTSPFDSADPYFNSGVLLIDRAKWAAADLPALLDRLVESGEIGRLYYDQDVLNLAFRESALLLDPRWNVTKPHPAIRALDPYIVHYTTPAKPWTAMYLFVAFGATYRHVMTRDVVRSYARFRRRRWLRRLLGR